MKRTLFILLSVFFLQTTICICAGTNAVNTAELSVCTLANDLEPNLSDEEQTENNFYNFIRYDVIGKDRAISPKSTLSYTGFGCTSEVHDHIINWIVPTSEREKFDKTKTYDSDLIAISFTEEVKDGFGKLTVTFKKRKDLIRQITVEFPNQRKKMARFFM